MATKMPTLLFSLQDIPETLGLTAGPAYQHKVRLQCTKEGQFDYGRIVAVLLRRVCFSVAYLKHNILNHCY